MTLVEENAVVKINLPGGIASAGNLYDILKIAEQAGANNLRFGTRQQLYFKIDTKSIGFAKQHLQALNLPVEINSNVYPNIISSYVTEEVFHNTNWLREDVYKDIFDLFNYTPQLKINLVGNVQSFVPLFNGNLNFITSESSNYWFLYIRFPKTNISYSWPVLIYSQDIPALTQLIEKEIFANKDLFYNQKQINGQLLYTIVSAKKTFITEPVNEPLKLPRFQLPYYEGFNRYGDKYWLGVYRRNEEYSIPFLKDVTSVCMETRVGQIYTTPWKTIIIKGISEKDRVYWDEVLTRHRINVRHASNELNWQTEDLCNEGLILKQDLVRAFDAEDVRTFKLCFAIKTKPKTGLFGSVVIKKQNPNAYSEEAVYDILYTKDFNPNSKEFIIFKKGVDKPRLAATLIEICDIFRNFQLNSIHSPVPKAKNETGKKNSTAIVYQCKHCLGIYDKESGEAANNIVPGTPFQSLPLDYVCATCEAPRKDFQAVEKAELY